MSSSSASSTAKQAAAKKAPAKKAPAKRATAKKTTSIKTAEQIQAQAAVVGPDGKKLLADVPDEQFEKDVKNDPSIKEDEKEATFIVSSADETDEPEQQVMVAGATADPVKDYLKQIGKVPLLNAEMEVELAKRIEAGLFSEEKLNKGGKISPKMLDELEWISADGRTPHRPAFLGGGQNEAHSPASCRSASLSWATSKATMVSDRTRSRTMASAWYFSPISGLSPARSTSCHNVST